MSMTSSEFFAGSGRGEDDAESFAFEEIGDGVVGDIVHIAPQTVETKFGTRLPIQIKRDDQSVVILWVNPGQMASAINEAVRGAGADGLAVGGRLSVMFESTKPTGKASPMKVYSAAYKAPTVNLGDAFPGATPATAADLL